MGKPVYLKVEKVFKHPVHKVWETVALKFGNVADYSPAVKSSRLDSEVTFGIGMRRHCEFEGKSGYIKEEITDWKDNEYFELSFKESSMPMAVLRSKFHFKEENGQTKLVQEFWYRMKAPMGWISFLMKGKMKKVLDGGLEGLEKLLNEN